MDPLAAQMLVGRQTVPEVAGEALAQRGELAIRVAVDGANGLGEGRLDVERHLLRNRVGVLVDVELDAHVLLRCAVRHVPAKVIADRQVVERDRGF